MIALEVLRVFEPAVYHFLPKSKEFLARQHDLRGRKTIWEEAKEDSTRLNALIDKAQPESKPAAEEILKQLFPRVTVILFGKQTAA